jgi:predicted CopG family antitoxin
MYPTEIDEIDAEIDKVHQSVEAKIADLNNKRNSASEVVRKYLGRKR